MTGLAVLGVGLEPLPLAAEQLTASPRDLNDLPEYTDDDRTLDKLGYYSIFTFTWATREGVSFSSTWTQQLAAEWNYLNNKQFIKVLCIDSFPRSNSGELCRPYMCHHYPMACHHYATPTVCHHYPTILQYHYNMSPLPSSLCHPYSVSPFSLRHYLIAFCHYPVCIVCHHYPCHSVLLLPL